MSWKETDILQLWKNSSVIPIHPNLREIDVAEKFKVNRLSGTKSKLWSSFLEMSPEQKHNYLDKLIKGWPFNWERRALIFPIHFSCLGIAISTTIITSKINADIHLCDPKVRILESIKKCTKTPVFLNVYTTGIINYLLYNFFVYKPIIEQDERPSFSWTLQKSIGTSLFTGIVFPVVASPHISYHINILRQRASTSVSHYIDFFTLSYEYSRSVWRQMPLHIIGQIVIATLTTYALLWGRNRIFETISIDPEFASNCIFNEVHMENKRWNTKFVNWLKNSSMFKKTIEYEPLKGPDDKESWKL